MGEDLSGWTGCTYPEVPAVEGRYVSIAPFGGFDDGLRLWESLGGEAANELLRYFPNPVYERGEEFAQWLVDVQDGFRTAVFSDRESGELLGMGSYMRIDARNGVVEIGAIAHGPKMARSPASTEAQYLLAAHVFENLGYRRYEWKCHNENEPSKRAARRLGFEFEGVFRQHMISKGQNRDTAWFSMIDKEWPQLRAGFEAWLDPSNFDASGGQLKRLDEIRSLMRQNNSGRAS
jgi:RimJ/RimL family protein N-acetyltransferase